MLGTAPKNKHSSQVDLVERPEACPQVVPDLFLYQTRDQKNQENY